ncbi:hypothetical protein Tco_0493270 [Tanacetum coccineum]
MRALYSSHIASFQLGSQRAWKGDMRIREDVVTWKLYLGLAFTIPTLERVTIGCCEVGGGGGSGGVVGGVGVVCGDGVDRGVGGVDCGFGGLVGVIELKGKTVSSNVTCREMIVGVQVMPLISAMIVRCGNLQRHQGGPDVDGQRNGYYLDRSMDSDKYLEGQSMQRPPLFESDSFIYWKNRFETYVKSKDLDLWHVITNGDFQPIIQNPETKLDEVVPFEKQTDDLKRRLAKNNEAKMVIYNALPRKEYERIFMCNTAKEIWKTLLITHQGNSQVKDNKIDLLVQQYEQFVISEDESIDSAFARFNTIITSLKALDEGYSSKNYVRKFLRALHPKWRAKVTAIEESKIIRFNPLLIHLNSYSNDNQIPSLEFGFHALFLLSNQSNGSRKKGLLLFLGLDCAVSFASLWLVAGAEFGNLI